jgi:hypothetical protein
MAAELSARPTVELAIRNISDEVLNSLIPVTKLHDSELLLLAREAKVRLRTFRNAELFAILRETDLSVFTVLRGEYTYYPEWDKVWDLSRNFCDFRHYLKRLAHLVLCVETLLFMARHDQYVTDEETLKMLKHIDQNRHWYDGRDPKARDAQLAMQTMELLSINRFPTDGIHHGTVRWMGGRYDFSAWKLPEPTPLDQMSITELRISIPTYNLLWGRGLETIGDLRMVDAKHLESIPLFGKRRLAEVREALAEHGVSLRGE